MSQISRPFRVAQHRRSGIRVPTLRQGAVQPKVAEGGHSGGTVLLGRHVSVMGMEIKLPNSRCHKCGGYYESPDKKGKRVRCPRCHPNNRVGFLIWWYRSGPIVGGIFCLVLGFVFAFLRLKSVSSYAVVVSAALILALLDITNKRKLTRP